MIKAFFSNSIGILTSRILGFFRDLLTASILGANIYSDIFFVAFKLPNLFRRIFAEGAFVQSFLPTFTNSNKKGVFMTKVLINFVMVLLFLSFFVMIFAPFITKALAFGFDEETIKLAVPLVKINFWYLLLIFLVTFCSSLLHYKNHFATSAFSTALLNLAMIAALLLADKNEPNKAVYLLSYGVIIGGFLQLITHLYALKKYNLLNVLLLSLKHYKKTKKHKTPFYSLFFHGLLGSSTAQIASFIDTWLASFLVSGSISYLYYANRIFQLPLALFAIALSTTIFPKITRSLKNNDEKLASHYLNNGFWVLFFLLSASSLGGIILSEEIVKILFERGSFSHENSIVTAKVLQMYLIGLLPFGLCRIFSLYLYAKSQQKKAAQISFISLLLNVCFSFLLIKPLGVIGLALAGSLSGFVLFVLTIYFYGIKKILAIIFNIRLLFLIFFLFVEWWILKILKDFYYVYF